MAQTLLVVIRRMAGNHSVEELEDRVFHVEDEELEEVEESDTVMNRCEQTFEILFMLNVFPMMLNTDSYDWCSTVYCVFSRLSYITQWQVPGLTWLHVIPENEEKKISGTIVHFILCMSSNFSWRWWYLQPCQGNVLLYGKAFRPLCAWELYYSHIMWVGPCFFMWSHTKSR